MGRRRLLALAAGGLVLAGAGGLVALHRAGDGPDGAATPYSREVVDRNGRLLRPFQTDDDMWRFPGAVAEVDPLFLKMLTAFEDRRFAHHPGVDPLALARATGQWLRHGRIVSGGSTLSMQVARLIDKREDGRSLSVKLREIARAVRLERELGKPRMLDLYLSLAPYGGNVEGIRAASLAYFGKEPRRLSPGEAALLVAIPQSPEARRPDRHPEAARRARDRVLDRMLLAGVLKPEQVASGKAERVPVARRPMPTFAWHAANEAIAAEPARRVHRMAFDRTAQEVLETLLRDRVRAQGARLSGALIAIDHRSGEVIARIGAADPLDTERQGAVDMTRAVRSPGSTLKPFIYAMAYEAGLAHPETLIEDRPSRFGTYAPANFDRGYQGTVPTRVALQMSLNVPAVALLEAVGPQRFFSRLEQAGIRPQLPRGEVPGLAVGLGGVGLRLADLAALYAGLARGGEMPALVERLGAPQTAGRPVTDEAAAWHVGDILTEAPAPDAAITGRLAYKTGTSYGFRDAWAVGFDGRRTIAVWVGRPDGSSVPGITGRTAAAPILFDAFARLGAPAAMPPRPSIAPALTHAQLPAPLRRFGPAREEATDTRDLKIAFPPDGVRVDLGALRGAMDPLVVRTTGGRPPFTVLLDGRPAGRFGAQRQVNVQPDGPGFTTLSVVDGEGRSASVTVRVE
ncbi:penicillin-binding protein 1C [Phreatobacter oligotrophus]|uniref:penicillin-binding protein 1C n=1 Tax=Phreatobacter oligotrophus TaxID=1122261 RepID=UPI002357AC4F|nr:penicillin-binding protein 1C [Phreatobacter oligotrophus]MBX9992856.1 penicillin-binding protein 1C [Phreatobacter oligotrophus]